MSIPFVDRFSAIAKFYLCFFHQTILPVGHSTLATYTPFANAWYGSGKTKLGRMITSPEYLKENLASIVSEMFKLAFSGNNVFSRGLFSKITDTFDLWMKNEHTTLGRFFPNKDFEYSIGYIDSKQEFVECDFKKIKTLDVENYYKNRKNGKIEKYSTEEQKKIPFVWWYSKKVMEKWISVIIGLFAF